VPLSRARRAAKNYVVAEFYLQWILWDFGRTYGRFRQAELVSRHVLQG